MDSADVVIIGGGIVGAAIADAISSDGTEVLLIERGVGHSCRS